MDFPPYLLTNYSAVRQQCEQNVREYYKKSVLLRNDDHFEIQFKEIFDHMAALYGLDDMQKDQLMQWEIEGELEAVIPLVPQISLLKKYIAEGNDIVLISDMYLPKEVIVKLLQKADPLLATLPLYVSSEVGHQKTTRKLFLHVYSDLDYCYDLLIRYSRKCSAYRLHRYRFRNGRHMKNVWQITAATMSFAVLLSRYNLSALRIPPRKSSLPIAMRRSISSLT